MWDGNVYGETLPFSFIDTISPAVRKKISSLHSAYKQNPLTGPNSLLLGYRLSLKDFLYYFSCFLYKSCAQRTGDIDLL